MTTSTNDVRALLHERFEPRRLVLTGRITAAPLSDGRSTGVVYAEIAGQSGVPVRVPVDIQPPPAPGDEIRVQQFGAAASAYYAMLDRTGGGRPDSGVWQFSQASTVNGTAYAEGDVLLGSTLPGWSNWWYVFESGHWQMRSGSDLHGAIGNLNGLYDYTAQTFGAAFGTPTGNWLAADEHNGVRMLQGDTVLGQWSGRVMTLGEHNQPRLQLSPGLIEFLDGAGAVQMALDGTTRTIYGVERLGSPLGPGIELGATAGGRYRWAVLGEDGAPFWSVVSGTTANPNDISWRAGADDAAEFIQLKDGRLTWAAQNASLDSDGVLHASGAILDGTITANAGTIGGWTLSSTQLAATAGNMWINGATGYIDTSGCGIDASGPWVLWGGTNRANAANAAFRVNSSGDVYLTSVKALTASNSSGFVVDVTGSAGGSAGCFKANGAGTGGHGLYVTGTAYGLYVDSATSYGVYIGGAGTRGVYAQTSGDGDHAIHGKASGSSAVTAAVYAEGVLESTSSLRINGTKVIGERVIDARCDDTINSGDVTTDGVIDALRDAMIAHGLIAAA